MNKCDFNEEGARFFCECGFDFVSQCGEYKRCPGSSDEQVIEDFGMIIAKTRVSVENNKFLHISSRHRDFIVRRRELVWEGEMFEPKVGHAICWTDAMGFELTFDLTNEGRESVWDNHDYYGYCLRLHTKCCSITAPNGLPVTEYVGGGVEIRW